MGLWDWTGRVKWSFVVDTDAYAGNFERELCGYVTGCSEDGEDHHGAPYRDMFMADYPEGHPFEDFLKKRLTDPGDDGYGRTYQDLAPTPGWGNFGQGDHKKLEAFETAPHPAFQSVAIFLRERPPDEVLSILTQRAYAFPKLPKRYNWDSRPTILGCRLVSERVVLESIPLQI